MSEINEVHVNVKIADAGPAGWIAYAIATWIAWAFLVGFVGPDALLYMACVSLACTIPYLGAAITQLRLGNVAGGVTWLYFGAFFAFCSALTYAVGFFAPIYGWQVDARILGFEWAVLSITLILSTPIFLKYTPAAAGISVVAADIGLVTLTLIYWGIGGAAIAYISGWAFFVAGLLGIVMAAGGILQAAGMKFPMGKPLMP